MVNLIYCELLKLKRSKLLLISLFGMLTTPLLMLLEALQTHFEHPEQIFTLADLYDNSLIYIMLLVGMMIYVVIAAYLFSREYTEKTLKSILPIPVEKTAFVASKFCVLFLWIMVLTVITWAGMLALATVYHLLFTIAGFSFGVALIWLGKMLLGGILMFLTISPFAFLAEKAKNLFMPMIASAVVAMGNAALANQDIGALYPWTAAFFLLKGKLALTGYPGWLSISILVSVCLLGFAATFIYFKKEDIQ